MAGLPKQLLDELRAYSSDGPFSDRERDELAELTAIVAKHHCLEAINSNLPAS
jgi:alkylhydroperoxidase family enzyme